MPSGEELLDLDRRLVWHPYSAMPAHLPPLAVDSAHGVRLRLQDGRELIDGMASWWCAVHGYRHPVLDEAARDQLGRMSHVMFGGLTHEPGVTARQSRASREPRLEERCNADRARAHRGARAGARPSRRRRRPGAGGDRRCPARPRCRRRGGDPGGGRAGRVAAPLPRPRVHDAAVCDR